MGLGLTEGGGFIVGVHEMKACKEHTCVHLIHTTNNLEIILQQCVILEVTISRAQKGSFREDILAQAHQDCIVRHCK